MAELRMLTAAQTHSLRRAVLRNGDPDARVAWAEDERPGAFHLGAVDGGEVVATASFSEEPLEARPGAVSWRLRGMAVAATHQGQGLGHAIVEQAVQLLRERAATVLWCNARDSASDFYAKEGFVMDGDGFNTDETGLPHHRMVLDL